ncbi:MULTISPECIES: type II toxin-antitoxin system RelB/ParD family antitoxin [Streptococcus]|uniref:type II toxin-antitoxin system RelB/ParD family antitoxin n=1 Tax=Streptococcus TaxID=1301 RepID=UPI000CF5A54B|nr:type II toxin-antitoxin system RelB/DinJ family antitoxin [Streptococcus suis]MBM0194945.1 type II toxin-antitoxin system RelB/DinJ family antitoxin [Streptococcus suis]MBM7316315.1 type II toxin-antitoxin system RelB/DinJ family antitoxin [Streptococcus suis]HEM4694595.1 type II toxin-antitoxin system RelB/DinJ family antitoxin [Streptococcus suis]HEM4858503.1 type II toxin-antitoxin system RelB/DinJ family antitoxin [Streptococcus suis]HEM4896431.1 type II toxin-antitoxin system RelB/DinJ
MSLTAEKKLINFQSEKSLVEEAKEVLASQNMTMPQALNLFLKNIVVTGEIGLKSEELEKERLFAELQAEVMKNVAEMNAGNYLSLDEMETKLFG